MADFSFRNNQFESDHGKEASVLQPWSCHSRAIGQAYSTEPPPPKWLRRGVAEAFVEALRIRDLQTVEWLISPLLFVNDINKLGSSDWMVVRQDCAFQIVIDHWKIPFAEAQFESTNDVSNWVVTTPSHRYRLWLEPFDGMIFVTAFESMDEGSEESRE